MQQGRTIMKATPSVLFATLMVLGSAVSGQPPKVEIIRSAQAGDPAGRSEDEKAIRSQVAVFVDAFGKGDAKAIAALFTEQGEAIDADGAAIRGRKALEAHYAERFQANPGEKIEVTIDLIHFLAPEVVREDGRSKLILVGDSIPLTSKFTATLVKSQGRWLVASLRELEDTTITHHERLKELEWMVGEWVEESGDALIATKVAWSDDENFLLRSFEVRVAGKLEVKGTQRIGWDPLTKQIKSWVFDSRGGFADGYWTRDGDHWVIKSSGVRPDGLTTSATQVLTRAGKDRLLWKSSDRTVGGETVAEHVEYMMVRKPPEPK
jgi:uncharacterized protein (TIGR02246 family)